MDYYDLGETTEAKFIKRLNRFVATVELNGNLTEVHIANTGRMGELLYNGARVWLKKADNLKRKLAYDLLLSEYAGRKICLNAHLAHEGIFLSPSNTQMRQMPHLLIITSYGSQVPPTETVIPPFDEGL